MKLIKRMLVLAAVSAACATGASAQYLQVADQIGRMITPALSGGFNYKGYVEASYLKGVGSKNADFVEITTTQGFRYADWFFMGVGAGVEAVMTNPRSNFNDWENATTYFNRDKETGKTGWVIPLYTDFRFTFGGDDDLAFFIDLRLGASFLVSNRYLSIGDGYMTSSENFYLRPSLGMRIPISDKNKKQAINLGVTYQLITSNYWYYSSSSTTLSAVGVTIGFEW